MIIDTMAELAVTIDLTANLKDRIYDHAAVN